VRSGLSVYTALRAAAREARSASSPHVAIPSVPMPSRGYSREHGHPMRRRIRHWFYESVLSECNRWRVRVSTDIETNGHDRPWVRAWLRFELWEADRQRFLECRSGQWSHDAARNRLLALYEYEHLLYRSHRDAFRKSLLFTKFGAPIVVPLYLMSTPPAQWTFMSLGQVTPPRGLRPLHRSEPVAHAGKPKAIAERQVRSGPRRLPRSVRH
jgi:hypothetical protein